MLQVTKNRYKWNSMIVKVNEDLTQLNAWSYNWFKYLTTDLVGNVYFLDTKYSITTSTHYNYTKSILSDLGIDINLTLNCDNGKMGRGVYLNSNFSSGIKKVIRDNIRQLVISIRELQDDIKKPKSHKRKNKERQEAIDFMKYRIKDLRRYCVEYVDKKLIPVKEPKISEIFKEKERSDIANSYKKYFLKDNGKLKVNEFQSFIKRKVNLQGYYLMRTAPHSIDKIKEFFKTKDVKTILMYQHSNDLNNMLPNLDTPEYDKLKIWLAQRGEHPFNTFLLDKLHTHLINKNNRKTYSPSEPKEFPVNKKLLKLESLSENNKLRIIKNDKELKAEGRSQSHCIGSKNYIDSCLRGYQALNYKGFTFFLNPDLEINQTHGRFNSHTPEDIRQELKNLIKSM